MKIASEYLDEAALGSVVLVVLDLPEETIIRFSSGKETRLRKQPRPEYMNSIKLLEQELLRHKTLPWSQAHVPLTPAGTELSRRCVGFDIYRAVADGKGDYTESLVERNATSCGYIPYPPRGSILEYKCSKFNYMAVIADGRGGSYEDIVESNSAQYCGYVPPPVYPPAGTILGRRCVGFDLYKKLADGAGGSYEVVEEANNVGTCGYVAPIVYPPAGTELSRRCIGVNLYRTLADGSGGGNETLLEENAASCGYVRPNLPSIGMAAEYVAESYYSSSEIFVWFFPDGTWKIEVTLKSSRNVFPQSKQYFGGRWLPAGGVASDYEIYFKTVELVLSNPIYGVANRYVAHYYNKWSSLGVRIIPMFLDCMPYGDTMSLDEKQQVFAMDMYHKTEFTIRNIHDHSKSVTQSVALRALINHANPDPAIPIYDGGS